MSNINDKIKFSCPIWEYEVEFSVDIADNRKKEILSDFNGIKGNKETVCKYILAHKEIKQTRCDDCQHKEEYTKKQPTKITHLTVLRRLLCQDLIILIYVYQNLVTQNN